jgi:hypothetical protein
MDARSPHPQGDRGASTTVKRAQRVLDDDMFGRALVNIAATQVWSAHRRDLVLPEVTRAEQDNLQCL